MATSVNVRQVSKDTVRIVPSKGFEVTVMVGTKVQAMLSDGEDAFVIGLEPPKNGETVEVTHNVDQHGQRDGSVDVVYKTA